MITVATCSSRHYFIHECQDLCFGSCASLPRYIVSIFTSMLQRAGARLVQVIVWATGRSRRPIYGRTTGFVSSFGQCDDIRKHRLGHGARDLTNSAESRNNIARSSISSLRSCTALDHKNPRVIHSDSNTSSQLRCICPSVSCLLSSSPSLLRYKTRAHPSLPSPPSLMLQSRPPFVTQLGPTSPLVPTLPASRPINKILWTCVALMVSSRLPLPPR